MQALNSFLRSRVLAVGLALGILAMQFLIWQDGKFGNVESFLLCVIGLVGVFLLFEIADFEKVKHRDGMVNTQLNEINRKYREDIRNQVIVTDNAYHERNRLVALLARMFPSGLRKTEIEGWDPAWHNCVYIDTPAGQVSYHFHDREAELFEGLPPYTKPWDGHTKDHVHGRWADPSTKSWLIPIDYLRRWAYERRNLAYNCIDLRADEVANMLMHTEELDKMLMEFISKRQGDDRQLQLDLRDLQATVIGQQNAFFSDREVWAGVGT